MIRYINNPEKHFRRVSLVKNKVWGIRRLRKKAEELVDMWGGSSLAESFNEGRRG